jgi:hypothetical protein
VNRTVILLGSSTGGQHATLHSLEVNLKFIDVHTDALQIYGISFRRNLIQTLRIGEEIPLFIKINVNFYKVDSVRGAIALPKFLTERHSDVPRRNRDRVRIETIFTGSETIQKAS